MAEPDFYVIVYDIVNDKRRSKVAKTLEALGERVQYSVFEVYSTPQALAKLLKRLTRLIEASEDGIRIYQLCEACKPRARSIGVGQLTPPPEVEIV